MLSRFEFISVNGSEKPQGADRLLIRRRGKLDTSRKENSRRSLRRKKQESAMVHAPGYYNVSLRPPPSDLALFPPTADAGKRSQYLLHKGEGA